jgi:hypothetical protein
MYTLPSPLPPAVEGEEAQREREQVSLLLQEIEDLKAQLGERELSKVEGQVVSLRSRIRGLNRGEGVEYGEGPSGEFRVCDQELK